MESRGFKSLPLWYQKSRIYWFHQHFGRIIGRGVVWEDLQVEQAICEILASPDDPRLGALLASNWEGNQEAAEQRAEWPASAFRDVLPTALAEEKPAANG